MDFSIPLFCQSRVFYAFYDLCKMHKIDIVNISDHLFDCASVTFLDEKKQKFFIEKVGNIEDNLKGISPFNIEKWGDIRPGTLGYKQIGKNLKDRNYIFSFSEKNGDEEKAIDYLRKIKKSMISVDERDVIYKWKKKTELSGY